MTPGVAARRTFNTAKQAAHPWLARWLFGVAALVVVMVAVGGATRLTDSGLSITEWKPLLGAIPPLGPADWADAFAKYKAIPEYKLVNSGMSLADFKTIFWWEWSHRFLGRFIGAVFAVPLMIFWISGAVPRALKGPLLLTLGLGALQGFVGWYMVQSGLTERVDVSHYRLALHLALAFIILGALTWLALEARIVDPLQRLQPARACARRMALLIGVMMLLQVVLGAFVAGTKAGLTYNTWPLMDGDLVPAGLLTLSPWYMNVVENLTTIQFNHRMMAYALVIVALVQALSITRQTDNGAVISSAWLLGALMIGQAGLGIWTLLAVDGAIPLHLGVAHQTLAAVVFAVAVWHLHACWHAGRG